MNRLNVGVVIVSFNTRELLRECLASLVESTEVLERSGVQLDVWVVDNASGDGCADMVEADFPGSHLIRSSTNDGFGTACNRAIGEIDADYVLLLNPDTRVTASTLLTCAQYAEANPNVGIVGCRVVLPDGSLDRACKRGIPTPLNALYYFLGLDRVMPNSRTVGGYNATYVAEFERARVGAVVGAFMWIRSKVLDDIGGFDEEFFMYGEDLDFCYRTSQAGHEIMYLGDCSVDHVKGASSGIAASSTGDPIQELDLRVRMVQEFHRAMLIFYRKHYRDRYPAVVRNAVHAAVRLKCWIAVRRELRRRNASGHA